MFDRSKLNQDLFILDSLAFNLVNKSLKRYINGIIARSNRITMLAYPVQSYFSKGCGVYCIFFVLLFHAAIENRLPKLIPFTHFKNNDSICVKNIEMLIRNLK